MTILERLSGWTARLRSAALPPDEGARYRHDPLSHPALRGMDQRQLADLPFPRLVGEAAPAPERADRASALRAGHLFATSCERAPDRCSA